MTSGAGGGRAGGSGLPVELLTQKLYQLGNYNGGVWRGDLITFLGPELCAQLHITKADGIDELRAKVIWHLRRIARLATKKEKDRQALEVRFNITPFLELREMQTVQERAGWFQKNHKGLSERKIRTLMSLAEEGSVLPTLVQELGQQQPSPPPDELAAIIAEFLPVTETQGIELDADSPIAAARRLTWQRVWTVLKSKPVLSVISGTVATVLGAAVIAGATDLFAPAAPQSGPAQELLQITPYALESPVMWNVVFPADAQGIEGFMTKARYEPDTSGDPFSNAELDAGAYLAGSATLRLEFENLADQEMTLFDVRVNSLKREPVPLGAAIFVGPIGGDPPDYLPRELYFDLDSIPPEAQQMRGEGQYRPFFSVERIGFRPKQKQTLLITLDTDRAAYSFGLEFHYEVGGKKFVKVLNRNGEPFRVAVNVCLPFRNSALEGMHYTAVRSNEPFPGGDPLADGNDIGRLLELHSLDPVTACASVFK